VGTPSLPDGLADLSFVEEVARKIGRSINEYKIIVLKSTVPIGIKGPVIIGNDCTIKMQQLVHIRPFKVAQS
jgi:UDP-glucose 6-dehydrogenase